MKRWSTCTGCMARWKQIIRFQGTIKKAELTAFLCLLKELFIGYGESRECITPRAGDADSWIKIWEEVHRLAARDIVVKVEHVKAHRTKKEKKEMSHFEKFITEGNEKADELTKAGARQLTKGLWQKREERQCSRSEKRCKLALVGGGMERL